MFVLARNSLVIHVTLAVALARVSVERVVASELGGVDGALSLHCSVVPVMPELLSRLRQLSSGFQLRQLSSERLCFSCSR